MTDPKLEQQARELLATACGERVEDMLYDRPGSVAKDQAIRAIVAALSQQPAVPTWIGIDWAAGQPPTAVDDLNAWRAAFVAERAMRYREGGMAIEQARIHAETDAARIDALAAPQPPAEAQPCGCGEATCTVPWEPGCGLGKSEQHAVVESAPPSAPVGVEDGPIDASDNAEYIEHCADRLERLGLRVTAGALRVIAHEHRTLSQQPAAVDGDNPYPAPRNRQEAAALAKLALAYLGVTSAHIDAAVARCETDLTGQQQGGMPE